MLALNDPRWSTLSHSYGAANNIPALLRYAASFPQPQSKVDTEPWFSLWSALCHQGDAYSASYAALPHIVQIAQEATGPIDSSFFLLPAAIEIARNNGRGPILPDDLAEAYATGLAQLSEAIARHRSDAWDQYTLISALSALAAAKGHPRVAEAIMNLDDHLITRLVNLDFDV